MSSENSIVTIYRMEKLCEITSGAISTLPPITHIAVGSGGVKANGDGIVDANSDPIPPDIDAAGLQANLRVTLLTA